MDEMSNTDTFEHDVEMLKYFQDEFKYRHAHYWNILSNFFLLTVVIAILPIASEVLGITLNNSIHKFSLLFPVLSIVIAILGYFILQDEAKKMNAVQDAKYRINRQNMDTKYHYNYYNDDVGKVNNVSKNNNDSNNKNLLSFKIAEWVLSVELFISVLVIIVISAV